MHSLRIHLEQGDALEQLMPLIEGNVFHVSKLTNWMEIKAAGKIVPNKHGELKTSFGSFKNSYFKNKGCVSVFDYRNIHEEEPQKHKYKCNPTAPLKPNVGIIIFILPEGTYSNLASWTGWKEGDLNQMVVPHIEAGYQGAIDLSLIETIIFVTTQEPESSSIVKVLGRHLNKL